MLSAESFAMTVPVLKGRVNDYAELISDQEERALEAQLASLESKTKVQVAILTVNDLQDEDIKSFGLKVAESWQLGQDDADNGLIILYTVAGDHYRMEVGYGLEGAIPDGLAGQILRENLRPYASPKKSGTHEFGKAFSSAVTRIAEIVNAEYAKDPTGASMRKQEEGGEDALLGYGIIFLAVLLVAALFGVVHPLLGGCVGGIGGGATGILFALSMEALVVTVLLGFIIGCIAKHIVEGLMEVAGSGGGGPSWSGGSGGSSWGGSGFSGGGGDFGGGGADD